MDHVCHESSHAELNILPAISTTSVYLHALDDGTVGSIFE